MPQQNVNNMFSVCIKENLDEKTDLLDASHDHKMNQLPLLFMHRPMQDDDVFKKSSYSKF